MRTTLDVMRVPCLRLHAGALVAKLAARMTPALVQSYTAGYNPAAVDTAPPLGVQTLENAKAHQSILQVCRCQMLSVTRARDPTSNICRCLPSLFSTPLSVSMPCLLVLVSSRDRSNAGGFLAL